MQNRKQYVLAYIGCAIGTTIIAGISGSIGLTLLLAFVSRLIVNVLYANKLDLPTYMKVLVGIFSTIGFLYLMGYNKDIKGGFVLVNDSLNLYQKHFKMLTGYALVYMLVIVGFYVIGAIIFAALFSLISSVMAKFIVGGILGLALLVGAIYIGVWFFGAFMLAIQEFDNGNAVTLKSLLQKVRPQIGSIFGASFLSSLIQIGPFLLGIILLLVTLGRSLTLLFNESAMADPTSFTGLGISVPMMIVVSILFIYGAFHSIYFSTRLNFSVFAAVYEKSKTMESIKRSMAVTKGLWWVTFWRLLVPGFLFGIVFYIVSWIFSLLMIDGNIGLMVISFILSMIAQIIFMVCIFLAQYYLWVALRDYVGKKPKATPSKAKA